MRRIGRFLAIASVALAGCGGDGSVFSTGPAGQSGPSDDVGSWVQAAEVLPPDPGTIIPTAAWGEVYDRRLLIRLADGRPPAQADTVAAAVNGTVVARIEGYAVYEIELASSGEAALAAALDALAAGAAVAIAAPSSPVSAARQGVDGSCGPLDFPVLRQEGRSDQFDLIGVEDAWRMVQASGVAVTRPTVGIVDGWGSQINHHGGWVSETVAATDIAGNPPGVADAVLGDGAVTLTAVDVFGQSRFTSVGSYLSGVTQMVDDGATVVNLSLGGASNPGEQALVRQFLRDLAARHPDVVVVAAAGNGAADVDGFAPGGLSEPNLVTVGGLNHQGGRWWEAWTDADGMQHTQGSNFVGSGGEVTLSALAQDAFVGVATDGTPITMSGTSFAAPQVSAAAAVLKAIEPSLTAAEIKEILTATAATQIDGREVDPALGGRVLRIDEAVYRVLTERHGVTAGREDLLGPLTLDVAAVPGAENPLEYALTATVPGGGDTTEVRLSVEGPGSLDPDRHTLTTQNGTAAWSWSFLEAGQTGEMVFTRTDTGACSRLVVTAGPAFPYAGTYEATFSYADTDFQTVTMTLVVDAQGAVVGDGEAEHTWDVPDGASSVSVSDRFVARCEGRVDAAGVVTCPVMVQWTFGGAWAGGDQSGGPFPMTLAIGPDGTLTGTITFATGATHPVAGRAVSGGPLG